jgi:hypothetical protein
MRYLIYIFLIVILNGCGSGDIKSSIEADEKFELYPSKSLIDAKHQEFYTEFFIENGYADDIEVELSNLVVDLNSCRVDSSTLSQDSVRFIKKGQKQKIGYRAEFIKSCVPNALTLKADIKLIFDGTENYTEFQSQPIPIEIDGNITHEDIVSIFDYGVILTAQDSQQKIGLNSKKRYKLSLVNLDSNNSVLPERIHKITISTTDPSKAKIIDPNNYVNDNGEPHESVTFENKNDIDLYIQTYNRSGIVMLNVNSTYTNNRKEVYDLNKSVPLTILSGEPMAFSINSVGTTYNFDTKWFEQKFLISASDKYNNIVNIASKINISAMADFVKNSKGDRLLFGKYSDIKGEIIADKENNEAKFSTNRAILSNIDPTRDFLFLFGGVQSSEALGKWDIDAYEIDESNMKLIDSYYGNNHSDLGFAVGHNYHNEICSSESKEWELEIDSTDGIYQLDDRGKTYVTLKFPAYMIGKKIALGVNFSGRKIRSGEVHFETLHNFEGVKLPDAINIEANTTKPIQVFIPFEIDTGTEDRFWVKNAKVVCDYETKNIIVTRFKENREIKSIKECGDENGEVAFWSMELILEDLSKDGSFTFNECQVESFINKF